MAIEVTPTVVVTKGENKCAIAPTVDFGFADGGPINTMKASIPDANPEAFSLIDTEPGTVYATYKMWNFQCVPVTSTKKELAIQMLDSTNASQENYDLAAYGLQGEHWEPVGENQYKVLNDRWRWFPYAWVWNPAQDRVQDTITGRMLELENNFRDPDFFVRSPLTGFNFDPEPVKNEWAQHSAIFAKYRVVGNGAMDPVEAMDKWAAEDLENIKIIMAEMQNNSTRTLQVANS